MTIEEAPGLNAAQAAKRLAVDGFNELPAPDRRGVFRILGEVLQQPMLALLIGAGAVYFLLGDRIEALLLLAFACLSIAITIIQETRSEHVLEALRKASGYPSTDPMDIAIHTLAGTTAAPVAPITVVRAAIHAQADALARDCAASRD